ncbi:MAG: alpha-glucosidase/alpha-galactosidase [Anaerolineae bacterium]|nr:alpha-glucosidase/alpha-galactosidase [Anaerolineae bacterium]
MTKITLLGAGSTVFAKNLIGDILGFPELSTATISLHDIDEQRLRTSEIVAQRVAQTLGAHPTIEASLDRRKTLEGADYAIGMFQIGGYDPATIVDFEVPKKYGLRQTIADTLGIGGIMRALRTIPVMQDMCHDMEEVSQDHITFLNYVNPMAMNCWALFRSTKIPTIGLCHSVQGTAEQIARDIGISIENINYVCAGINHMAFYVRFEQKTTDGYVDLYPMMHKVIEEKRIPDWNRVRYDLLSRFGYFVTESSEHFAEYVPWYIKRDRPDLIEQYHIPLDEYPRRCVNQIAGWEFLRERLEAGDDIEVRRSKEYGSLIIHSMETGIPRVVYGSVPNLGIIDNLPGGCAVEVPVLVDRSGLQPTKIGRLPVQLAALMRTNINVQELTVEAALTNKRDYIYHAALLDPHTAAELDPDQITSLVDELMQAHAEWLPEYT